MSDSTGTHAATPLQLQRSAALSTPGSDRQDAAGRYELRGEIARGGMGVVVRAWDKILHREVAVKLLHPQTAGSSAEQQFLEEANITGQLQHPGIPPVYDLGTFADGRPFLAMKLVNGRTLDALLKEAPTDRGRWVGVFEGICQAVGYAHANGVIHRDLKPQNVMVGSFGEVQVMDWGLAKILTAPPSGRISSDDTKRTAGSATETPLYNPRGDSVTQAGNSMGTPAYIPPEQARGAVADISERSDVFGLGAILCAVLTGKPPFVGPNAHSSHRLAEAGDVTEAFARLDASGAEAEWIALAKRCLAPSPRNRPADGSAVAAAVAQLRADAELRARQAETQRAEGEVRAAEQRKRQRALTLAATLIGLVLVGGIVGTTLGLREARTARTAESQRADGERQAKESAILTRDKAMHALEVTTGEFLSDSLATQQTVTEDQKKFLGEVLPLYQSLARETGEDERTRVQIADAAFRVALIEFRFNRLKESAVAHRVSRDLYAALVTDFPANPTYRKDLAQCHHSYAVGLDDTGRTGEAEREYRIALKLRLELVELQPDDADHHYRLAWTYNNLGNIARLDDRDVEAERHYAKAMAIWDRLTRDHPAVARYLHKSGWIHSNYSHLLEKRDDMKGAEKHTRHALACSTRLVALAPQVADYRWSLAGNYENLADLLWQRDANHDAERTQRHAVDGYRNLMAEFPAVEKYRYNLAHACLFLGDIQSAERNVTDARENFLTALRLAERMHADSPGRVKPLEYLHRAHFELGFLDLFQKQTDSATRHYEEAIRHANRLIELDRDDTDYPEWLASSHSQLGGLYFTANQFESARPQFEAAARLLEKLFRLDPDVATVASSLAYCLERLGNLAERANDWKQAEIYFTRLLEVRQHDDPEGKRTPCLHAHFFLGRALVHENRPTDAETHLRTVFDGFSADRAGLPKHIRDIVFESGTLLMEQYAQRGQPAKAAAVRAKMPREYAPGPREVK